MASRLRVSNSSLMATASSKHLMDVAQTVQIFLYAYPLRFIRIHVGFCLSGYCFFFSPVHVCGTVCIYPLHFTIYIYPGWSEAVLPHSETLHFTLLYIYTAVEAKRFPVCAANSGSPAWRCISCHSPALSYACFSIRWWGHAVCGRWVWHPQRRRLPAKPLRVPCSRIRLSGCTPLPARWDRKSVV